ncbi:TPA: DUF3343 domain-containing protein [bacterium]|nr:DUF3343 domain-containing protein [bacterium]
MIKKNSDYGIVLFETTQSAIKAEKVLIQAEIKIKMIPVPRHISANCGVSIRFDLPIAGRIKSILDENNVQYSAIRSLI